MQWVLSPAEIKQGLSRGSTSIMYREPVKKSMGSLGTFKPRCLRGHVRKGNLDSSGHCLSCAKLLKGPRAERKREKMLTFKPLCKYGHVRRGNLTPNGHCKTCKEENKGNGKYGKVGCWKRNGVLNRDKTQFTAANYNHAFKNQNGKCKGCSRPQSMFKKALIADHDHKTGIFRGLLCFHCNFILGLAYDNPTTLKSLAIYLRRQP